MKILILTRYTRMGASSRLRFHQYLPLWEAAGITCDTVPLLNEQYLEDLYAQRPVQKKNLLRCYARVFGALRRARAYDAVVVEKEVFPFLPPLAEAWLRFMRVPYIVDYDDAIFHNYDLHSSRLVRFVLGSKIRYVMRKAALVVCGNAYLETYAREAGANHTAVIPTVIDADRYRVKDRKADAPVVIGWIGSPSSLKYLDALSPVLDELTAAYPAKVHIIGGKSGIGLGDRESVLEWTEEKEGDLIEALDIGIMPLEDSPWERGKCGYKLIQYMGCGLPVVGSPVGVNREIIAEGVNGFSAVGAGEWKERLERLIGDAGLRRSMGAEGRKLVVDKYALDRAAGVWIAHLKSVKRK